MALSSVPEAIEAIARGELVVVVDDDDRENEGDLIMAATKATSEQIAFMIRHTSGIICAPLLQERADGASPYAVESGVGLDTRRHEVAVADLKVHREVLLDAPIQGYEQR